MESPSFSALPDPSQLMERNREVQKLLLNYRIIMCTPHRPYGVLMLVNLNGAADGSTPQNHLGVCTSCAEVLERVPQPADDVLVLTADVLADGPVLPMLRQLRKLPSPPKTLITVESPHRVFIRELIKVGADALIAVSNVGRGGLLEALRCLDRGERSIDAECRAMIEDRGPASDELSAREVEILQLVAKGLTNRAIGKQLCIADVTARDHVRRILHKLAVSDRSAAVMEGVRLGYIH